MRSLLLLALVACSGRGEPKPDLEPAPHPERSGPRLLDDAPQVIVGIADDWDSTSATLTRYERKNGSWVAIGDPIPAALGRAGQAWGRGLHGDRPPIIGPTMKVEGDGKAPSGAFRIVRVFGYAGTANTGGLPYQTLDDSWRCVDDPASAHYNEVLDTDGVTVDWSSAEIMRRDDELYRWVIELDHNGATGTPAAGMGSCIFFHVWAGPDDTTAGCTAMDRAAIEELITWLRPGAVYVLLPRAEHAALAAAWGLPD